jgi:hypothetical protein
MDYKEPKSVVFLGARKNIADPKDIVRIGEFS